MKPGEKGYTLFELLVALPIMAIVCIAVSSAIFQVIRNTERNSNHMVAVLQTQNAGNWITFDIQRAQSITTNQTLPNFLAVSWIDGSSGDHYQITYTLEDTPGSIMKQLWRNQSIDNGADTATLIAQKIDSNAENTNCELADGLFTLNITSSEGMGATMGSETRTYQIVPRPD